jgi:lipopolysaccharide export system ATP-binding protein
MYQRARLGIGYLPQEASIFRGLNVEDNIRAVLEVVEPDKRKREALDALLDEFNITRLRKSPSMRIVRRRAPPRRNRARAGDAAELHAARRAVRRHRPDRGRRHSALVRHLTNRGIGVLITDHNVRETLGLTDRAYIIYAGEVLMEGRPEEIVNNPDVRRLYLGEEFRL